MSNRTKFDIKRTPERAELIKQMASSNRALAFEAQQAFAEFVRPAVQVVFNQKATASAIYQDLPFSKNERPTIPIDIFVGTAQNYISSWSQNIAGGLPTNLIQGVNEYTFVVYRLESAVSLYMEYIKNVNLPVLSLSMDRMINELVVLQERNAWAPLITAAAAPAASNIDNTSHVLNSKISGVFQLEDFNTMLVKIDRMYESYAGGTPDSFNWQGLTDLFMSPEIIAQVRSWAYQPMNTRGGYNSAGAETNAGVVALPNDIREQIFKAAGMMEIYGINLHKMVEFGVGAKYNTLFANAYAGSFAPSTQQAILGFDLSRDVFIRPVIVDDDLGGGSCQVMPDDQFFSRSEKIGFWSRIQEGRAVLDSRAIVSLIV